MLTIRWKIAAVGAVTSLACAMLFPVDALGPRAVSAGQPTAAQDEPRPLSLHKPTPVYYGSAACSNLNCHGGQQPKTWVLGRELISRCNESLTWEKYDRHADAFKVLRGKRGQQMAKILGYDVTKAKECTSCHGVHVPANLAQSARENHFDIEEGVSCVACHGAYEEWVHHHSVMVAARKFRRLTPEQKESIYGMANLRDPVRQTELCVSCHVGNIEQGKYVTHEMYAAGHPPLPSFEIGTFVDHQPRHWQYLNEKSPALQKELGLRPGELEKSQLVLVSAFITMRDSMRLLAHQSHVAATTTDPDKKVIDLANFDCWSCHHAIRTPGWRQERGYKNTPGRVPWRAWPAEMIPAAIEHLASVDSKVDAKILLAQFDEKVSALEKAFDVRAYGSPALIKKASTDLESWSNALAACARAAYATKDSTTKVIGRMPAIYGKRGNDFDSARQVSWAFQSLYNDVHGPKGGDPHVRRTLTQLDKNLKLSFPVGRGINVEDSMDANLDAIRNYHPKLFRPLFSGLGSSR